LIRGIAPLPGRDWLAAGPDSGLAGGAMQKITLSEKLALFSEHWSPKIIAELNGQQVKLVKFRGEFVWHQHEHEDELFHVIDGRFRMEFRDRTVELRAGDMIVVPRGVEHRPVADEEVSVMLFEPASTVNTGNAGGKLTVARPGWI
jgi:mannose-6-phosphate isomerase-like protein (cupin superfamily)